MKKYLLIAVVCLFAAAGIWGLATAGISAAKLASLKARVQFLESAFSASDPQALLELLNEMEGRLDRIRPGEGWSEVRERLDSVLSKVSKLEDALGYPVVSAQEGSNLIGQQAAVYGTVQKARKSSDGYVFLTLDGGFYVAWFSPPEDFKLPAVGAGVVVYGTITEYNHKPEIVVASPSDLVIAE